MPFRAKTSRLSDDEHEELQRMSLSRSLPAGDVFRARLILMLAEGRSYTEIQDELNTTAPTISKWRKRFLEQRIDGLMQERHPGQKPICPCTLCAENTCPACVCNPPTATPAPARSNK